MGGIVPGGGADPSGVSAGETDIRSGYLPGAIGRIVELHGTRLRGALGLRRVLRGADGPRACRVRLPFRPAAGRALDRVRRRPNRGLDRDRRLAGGGGRGAPALVHPLRGPARPGTGRRLLDEAVGFCRRSGRRRVELWTFAGLDAARRLYEQAGFRLAEERRGAQWGVEVTEQRFELLIPDGR